VTLPAPDPAFHWRDASWGAALACRPLEAVAQHLFTTRQLELRPSAASDGWPRLAASMNVAVPDIQRIRQVHGRTVQVWRRGVGEAPIETPAADAQVSNDPAHVLAVQVADCVPILMADRRGGAAAAVHAGWRGMAARIIDATAAVLAREFGTRPDDLVVAIGPSIGVCCYQVGDELPSAFESSGASQGELARWFSRGGDGRLRLDLWTAARDQLIGAGVPPGQIFTAGLCTQTHVSIFDSFRAEGARAGRLAAVIRVPAPAGARPDC
jgi:YfiH family protein